MAAPDLPRPLRRDRTLLDLRGAACYNERRARSRRSRIIAEPSSVRGADEILTPEALDFLAELHERFDGRRRDLLDRARGAAGALRRRRASRLSARTRARSARRDWTVGSIPRRPASTAASRSPGRPTRKMVINALNSGAQGVHGRLRGRDLADLGRPGPGPGESPRLLARPPRLTPIRTAASIMRSATNPAVLMVRPRGWHLPEEHVTVGGEVVAGALFDFGALSLAQCPRGAGEGLRPLFLPAQAREPPRGGAVERRVRLRRGQARGSSAGRSRRRC